MKLFFVGAVFGIVSVFTTLYFHDDVIPESVFNPSRELVAVFVTHKRTHYLAGALRSFLSIAQAELFDVLISLDFPEAEPAVRALMDQITAEFPFVRDHVRLVLKEKEWVHWYGRQEWRDQRIDQHVMFALRQAFTPAYRSGVFFEEDLEFSPDFLELMLEGEKVLRADPTLYCVAGWSDYSMKNIPADPKRLIRTDVFPNLGFLITRATALDILSRWPGYDLWGWDRWMRREVATLQRECIAPELSRVRHVGEDGVHVTNNAWYRELPFATLPPGIGTFTEALSRMKIDDYDAEIRAELAEAEFVDVSDVKSPEFAFKDGKHYIVPVEYNDCRNGNITRKAFMEPKYVCRSYHRGLMAARIGNNSRVYFVERRAGAQWLPRDLWEPHKRLKLIPSNRNETCKSLCGRMGYLCSSHDAAHANTCDALNKAFECKTCAKSPSHRGSSLRPAVEVNSWPASFRPAVEECIVSERPGFFCDEPAPADASLVCPCIPKHCYFNHRYDYNQQ